MYTVLELLRLYCHLHKMMEYQIYVYLIIVLGEYRKERKDLSKHDLTPDLPVETEQNNHSNTTTIQTRYFEPCGDNKNNFNAMIIKKTTTIIIVLVDRNKKITIKKSKTLTRDDGMVTINFFIYTSV